MAESLDETLPCLVGDEDSDIELYISLSELDDESDSEDEFTPSTRASVATVSSSDEFPSTNFKDSPRTESPTIRLKDKQKTIKCKSCRRLERDTEVPRPLLQEEMATCSYVMVEEVVDECPLGHLLNPGLASLNVRTGILTVTCPECHITLHMKTSINS